MNGMLSHLRFHFRNVLDDTTVGVNWFAHRGLAFGTTQQGMLLIVIYPLRDTPGWPSFLPGGFLRFPRVGFK